MMKDWTKYKLSEAFNIIGGGTPKTTVDEYWNGDIPWLSVVDFNNDQRTVLKTEKSISDIGLKNSSTKLLKKGQLIISARGTVGQIAQLGRDMTFNQSCYGLDGLESILINDFGYYLLKHSVSNIQSQSHGSVFDTITRNTFENIEVCIPGIPEQRAIASILSALDDKIELNLQMNKTLEEMAMTLYKDWFVDFGPYRDQEFVPSELGEIPKGWEVKRLDALVKFSNGYAFKSSSLLEIEEEDCLHVFKMGHIQRGGGLKANGTKSWVKRNECLGLDKYILKVGDVLMSMTDMKDNMTILGHTALMNENDKYIVNQRVGLLRADNNIGIGYPFIFILTNSFDYIDRLRSQANSGVQVNLSSEAIKSSKVIVATKDVNVNFHNLTFPLFEQINQNAIENQTLTTLRDTLLPKLISGEVRVKDAARSLAEVL